MTEEQKNKPVKTFKTGADGYQSEVSVWKNEKGYSISVRRNYKDADGNWTSTKGCNLFQSNLLALAALLEQANRFIDGKRSADAKARKEAKARQEAERGPEPSRAEAYHDEGAPAWDEDDIPF